MKVLLLSVLIVLLQNVLYVNAQQAYLGCVTPPELDGICEFDPSYKIPGFESTTMIYCAQTSRMQQEFVNRAGNVRPYRLRAPGRNCTKALAIDGFDCIHALFNFTCSRTCPECIQNSGGKNTHVMTVCPSVCADIRTHCPTLLSKDNCFDQRILDVECGEDGQGRCTNIGSYGDRIPTYVGTGTSPTLRDWFGSYEVVETGKHVKEPCDPSTCCCLEQGSNLIFDSNAPAQILVQGMKFVGQCGDATDDAPEELEMEYRTLDGFAVGEYKGLSIECNEKKRGKGKNRKTEVICDLNSDTCQSIAEGDFGQQESDSKKRDLEYLPEISDESFFEEGYNKIADILGY